ncbi:MAG: helix-turn-helix domain-containing protein [Elusimicrobia bacterium]|nr:helix-turn-helix domain-containing protein [Elusimicrobiota bacterium]
MTQAQLAARAGLPQSHLAVIETGKVDLKPATLRKIFRALHGDLVVVVRFRKTPASLVAERIREVARKKIARVAGSMALENQRPDDAMTKRLIKAEEERLRRESSTEIWEE